MFLDRPASRVRACERKRAPTRCQPSRSTHLRRNHSAAPQLPANGRAPARPRPPATGRTLRRLGPNNPRPPRGAERTEHEQRVADFVFRTLGAEATLWTDITRGLTYNPGYTIMGGMSSIMRNILGERVLGLPR